jgi:hypothetical protein
MTQADEIRDFVVDNFTEPARLRGDTRLTIRAGDVHTAMKLENAMPAVCSAIGSAKFWARANIRQIGREGPANGSSVTWTFDLANGAVFNVEAAEMELRNRYGLPSVFTEKMVGFHLTDGRAVALQRDIKQVQVWVEAKAQSNAPPVEKKLEYAANRARHSNLPNRLKHNPPTELRDRGFPREVLSLRVANASQLNNLMDWYEGHSPTIDFRALEILKDIFISKFPDFTDFRASEGMYWNRVRREKQAWIEKARTLSDSNDGRQQSALGAMLLDFIGSSECEALHWRMKAGLKDIRAKHSALLENAAGELVSSRLEPAAATEEFVRSVWPAYSKGHEENYPYGDMRTIPTALLALVRPSNAVVVHYQPMHTAGTRLLHRSLFKNAPFSATEYQDVLSMCGEIADAMRGSWNWDPQDLWDIQSFIWETCRTSGTTPKDESHVDMPIALQTASFRGPQNLILYGPPGTGKTYATVWEAVRLCIGEDAAAPMQNDRNALTAEYRRLTSEGQIEFVTFHQSFSYEDFVESLRPVSETVGADNEQEVGTSGGFSLKVHPGIFKVISERARLDTGNAPMKRLDRSRPIYKIALGQRGSDEDRIQKVLDNSIIHLGWGGDINWSDGRFDSFEEIKKHWNEKKDPNASGKDPNIEMTYAFRSGLQTGDYVIISDGRDSYRAFGKVTGEYEFDHTDSFLPHRRKVEWIWRHDKGAERTTFYPKNFRRQAAYRLDPNLIDWDALEKVVIGSDAERPVAGARPHVLIIDEINRANISKVFGELITLLEADKRLGCENEVRVRLPYSGTIFGVPPNLHIIGTMNTADRSIALLDTALRRRFAFSELMPDTSALQTAMRANGLNAQNMDGINLVKLLTTINERIEYLFDREHQIGHAYFTGCRDRADVVSVMRNKVIPLLAEYFYEDWSKVAIVLGDGNGATTGNFLEAKKLLPPSNFNGDDELGGEKVRWIVKAEFDFSEFAA